MPQPSINDLLVGIATSTVQALYSPEKKDEWLTLLPQIRESVMQDGQLIVLIDNVLQLLKSDNVDTLHPELQAPYSECWSQIVAALRKKEEEEALPPEARLKRCLEALNQQHHPAQRLPLLHNALALVDVDKDAYLWAQLHVSLAQALSQLTTGDLPQQLEDAIASFRLALQVITKETSPQDWAYITMCLGNTLDERLAGDPGQNVEEAISAYRQSLEVYTRESTPSEWALTMMNLGIAYHKRAVGDPSDNVELSIGAMNDASSIITPATNPGLWIKLMLNTSNAYSKRIQGNLADNLETAIQFGQKALIAISPDRDPVLWASAAINLALAYSKRIAASPLQNLQQARKLLLAAEKVCPANLAVMEWLKISLNLNEVLQQMIPLTPADSADRPKLIEDMCERIWKLYGRTRSRTVLEQAVVSFQKAVEYTPDTSPDLPQYLIRLGICLEDLSKSKDDTQDLEQAISTYERAVQLTPPGTQQLPRNLNTLSLAFAYRYRRIGDLDDLRKSIEKATMSVKLSTGSPADQLMYLKNMSPAVEEIYSITKNPADRQELADCHTQILELSPKSEDQIHSHGQIGFCWMDTYTQTKDPADLDKAIEHYEKAIALVTQGGVRHSLFLAAGSARSIRFQLTHDKRDIDTAAADFEEADRRAPNDAPEKAAIFNNAAAANVELYELNADLQFLDKAIAFLDRLSSLEPIHDDLTTTIYLKIAELYRKKYGRTQSVSDLRAVVDYESKHLNAHPNQTVEREYLLLKICSDYSQLFDRGDNIADLETSISYSRSLTREAATSEVQLTARTFLSDFLQKHYRLTSEKADLDESLENIRSAKAICPDDSPLRASIDALSGSTLGFLFEKTGLSQYQEESTKVLDELRKRVEAGDKADAFIFTTLGHYLSHRFATLGDLRDLEDALDDHKKALAAEERTPKNPGLYTNLGNVFSDLYSATGNLQHLNEAIEAWGEAVRLSTPDSPYHSTRLNNLGSGWLLRYSHSRDPQDLEDAVEATRHSVDITDPGSINLPFHLSYLGQSLLVRYERAGNFKDLQDAVGAFQKGLELTQPGNSIHYQLITNLGQSLRLAYEATNDLEYLSTSIEALNRSLETILPTSRFYADILAILGADYQSLHEHDHQDESAQLMAQSYRRACQGGIPQRLDIVLNCSQWWGNWALARQQWTNAAEAFGYGIQALAKLYQAQVLRTEKETWLSEAQRIHSLAAYAFAQAGQLSEAVEVLEEGRARLLVEVLERHRAELKRLPELGHAEVYQRYSQAVDRLAYLEKSELQLRPESSQRDIAGEIGNAQRDLENAVEAIQKIHGFEHMFTAPSIDQIRNIYRSAEAQIQQPPIVIYLLLTSQGGLAIILDNEQLQTVPFELTEADLDGLMISKDEDKTPGGYLSIQFEAHPNKGILEQVLQTLGTKMMQPIAAHLEGLTPATDSENPRTLILVPTGRLSLFPLHAIPWTANDVSRILLDQFDIAFIPSLRSLSHCLETLASFPQISATLSAVGNPLPVPEGYAPLRFARPEVEEIARQFSGPKTLLCEDHAKYADVEACLGTGTYLHFSCHGQFDPTDPMLSGILLSSGERFTLRNLVTRPELTRARLAVLSACQTAITEFNKLPEEAIGLPSGFLQAGLPGVVGSLWPVQEISTALLMIRFYLYHLSGDPSDQSPPATPTRALRKAQLWLRTLTNAKLADLFNAYRKAAVPGETGIPLELAQSQFRSYALSPPNERPYAHPYYWAAFAFFGI